jgi:hypothetical protein
MALGDFPPNAQVDCKVLEWPKEFLPACEGKKCNSGDMIKIAASGNMSQSSKIEESEAGICRSFEKAENPILSDLDELIHFEGVIPRVFSCHYKTEIIFRPIGEYKRTALTKIRRFSKLTK